MTTTAETAPGFVWEGSAGAAGRVMGIVCDRIAPLSVVDIGCGVGVWLKAALAAGAERAVGVDAAYVRPERIVDPRIEFHAQDLEAPIALNERFDLALCLEVAEHLSPGRAESLVGDLCALSDCVLFGAAIPGQGGIGHVNERWQSYWAGLFAAHDWRPLDLVRPAIWGERAIQPWYRQNMLLYLAPAARARLTGARGAAAGDARCGGSVLLHPPPERAPAAAPRRGAAGMALARLARMAAGPHRSS